MTSVTASQSAVVAHSDSRLRAPVGNSAATVVINGVAVSVSGSTFTASVPVLEGTNTLTAVLVRFDPGADSAQVKGAVKDAAGKVTGDTKLQAEGKADKAAGKVQNAAGGAKDAARDAVDPDRT